MIANALHRHAAVSDREWKTDRSQTVGASEIGQCARRVFFLKNEGDAQFGAARDEDHEDGYGARVRGSVFEAHWWEPALRREFNDRLLFAGTDQRTFAEGFLSATPDGLVVGLERDALSHLGVADIEGAAILVECKTADPRTKLTEAKPEHVYQVQVQLGLVRLRTNHRPTYGLISYANTSFWNDLREFPVRFDEAIFESALRRATAIMTARSCNDLKPEGWIAGGRECEHCPFTGPCGRARADRVPDSVASLDPGTTAALADMARRAKGLKEVAERSAQDAREIEHEIRETLAQAGVRRMVGDGVSLTWSPVKGRPSWDMKGLREAAAAAGVDLSRFETVGDPSDRLVISLNGSTKDVTR